MNERRSILDTQYVTIKEWADVALDMAAPLVAFTRDEDEPSAWLVSAWVGASAVDPATGLNFRSHHLLIGPGVGAVVALALGRWVIWRQLTDSPEIPVDMVAGTITIF